MGFVGLTERTTAEDDALRLLRERSYSVREVVRVDSPGDAGTGAAEALYVTLEGGLMRAYIRHQEGKDPILWARQGWGQATAYDVDPED